MANSEGHVSLQPDADAVREPPTSIRGIAGQLGPGLIIAASIVGSGELIGATKTGAEAGMSLLWLIIIGCLIKVFVQIELGRYTIGHGETTLSAVNRVPGPRFVVNWIVWCWLLMVVIGFGQLGSIVGGVGQALALAIPIRGDYNAAIAAPSEKEIQRFVHWEDERIERGRTERNSPASDARDTATRGHEIVREQLERLGDEGRALVGRVRRGEALVDPPTYDDKIWAAATAVLTAVLLFVGRYALVQNLSIGLVVMFTFVTVGNVVALESTEQWRLGAADYLSGLWPRLPEATADANPWRTALATFGIIGVGASELFAYPYWCLEKGYARFVGRQSTDDAWGSRARGWMRVMRWDAFVSMVVYTVATLAFFITGVAVLHSEGRNPDGMRMVSTLSTMYVPVFGEYAKWLFLLGAFAVLYSTFLAATAGNARMLTDAATLFRFIDRKNRQRCDRWVTGLSVALPFVCLAVYCSGVNPVQAIIVSGAMQSLLLPMVGAGALYFRYTKTDPRIRPSVLWDLMLVASFAGLLVAGVWGVYSQGREVLVFVSGVAGVVIVAWLVAEAVRRKNV